PGPDRRDQAKPPDHRPVPPPDAGRPDHGQAAAVAPPATGPGLRRGRGPARPVRRLRDQRRHRPAVPDADPRSVVHPPPVGRHADARPPDRRRNGGHGEPGSHHGRGRQVTAMARSWSRLTLAGKILFTVIPILFVLTVGLVLLIVIAGKPIVDFLAANIWLVRFVVAATAILLMSVPTAFLIIYMEMKVIALMNLRIGPDRVGPFGSLLSVVHGLKVLMKEDFSPTGADRLVFTLAPVAVFMATIMALLVIPFAPGLFGVDMNIGLLYLFAVSGLTVVGLLMAGWSSFNKYSLLRRLRSAPHVVSYEIPLTLSVVGLLLLAGTMSLNQLAENQAGWFTSWDDFRQPLGAQTFFHHTT